MTTITVTIDRIELRCILDEDGDLSYLEQDCFNEDTGEPDAVGWGLRRIEAYNRGEWWFVGVRAVAVLSSAVGSKEIKSSGLWGIESDSERSYFGLVFLDEYADLRAELEALGFGLDEMAAVPIEVNEGTLP